MELFIKPGKAIFVRSSGWSEERNSTFVSQSKFCKSQREGTKGQNTPSGTRDWIRAILYISWLSITIYNYLIQINGFCLQGNIFLFRQLRCDWKKPKFTKSEMKTAKISKKWMSLKLSRGRTTRGGGREAAACSQLDETWRVSPLLPVSVIYIPWQQLPHTVCNSGIKRMLQFSSCLLSVLQ